jgi:hypothetical protein
MNELLIWMGTRSGSMVVLSILFIAFWAFIGLTLLRDEEYAMDKLEEHLGEDRLACAVFIFKCAIGWPIQVTIVDNYLRKYVHTRRTTDE